MNLPQRIASLSLDLDNQWSYLKVHGDTRWTQFPSYLDLLVPRVLDFLAKQNLKITFFIVGQDAALEKNHAALRTIAAAGHEIANHSFSHEPWFHLYDPERVESEIALAEDYIIKATGQHPKGYRGPGFSLTETTLRVLERRSYLYDASTFPTFIGPLARFYYLLHSNLQGNDRKDRSLLFGALSDGLLPLRPYRWRNRKGLLEIPVTTMPVFRTPIHLSYLLYLSGFSCTLAQTYFRSALRLCGAVGVSPSILIHPLDFLGADDRIGLEFFPGMQLTKRKKINLLEQTIHFLADLFQVVSLLEHSRTLIGESCQLCSAPTPRRCPSLKSAI
jgi:hypothetical protein